VFALVCLRRFAWLLPAACFIGLGSTLYWVAYTAAGAHAAVPGEALLFNVQNSRWSQLLLVQHGSFFALGVLLWWRWQRERTAAQWFWIGLFLIGGCLQIAGEANLKLHKTGLAFSPLVPCLLWLASVALIQASLRWNRQMHALPPLLIRASRRLGLMTYPLYLLHNVLGAIVLAVAAGLGASPSGALIIAMLASIGLSWWVSVRLEPPLQRWTRERLLRAWETIGLRRARSV
jgi:peptidoglycan/LPS O-acetylase OafA/YrhL